MLDLIRGKKTYVVGVAMILWGLWQYLVEENPTQGVQRIVEGIALITLRQGIAKVAK